MSLVGKAIGAVEQAVNIGIDSYLEACFVPDRGDYYKEDTRGNGGPRTLECKVSPESLPVLLRRLYEELPDSPLGDAGASLASDILNTIGIGEDGKLTPEET
jgi:hypothetical protein